MKTGKKSIKAQMSDLQELATATLKKEGKFTPLYSLQVELASLMMAKIRLIMMEMEKDRYKPIETEKTRDDCTRTKINPCEKLLMDYAALAMKAFKGLGMNTESKELKPDSDSLTEFLSEFQEGEQ